MLNGVDISAYQDAIPGGQDFVILKATESTGYVDSTFAGWWAELNGRLRGAYHFAHPDNGAITEAAHFLDTVSRKPGDLLVLDFEDAAGMSAAHCSQWARDWCSYVHQKTGVAPIIYTFLGFAWAGNCDGLGGYPLWIADPSSTAGKPRIPSPWTKWALHQWGSPGGIDNDVFNGSAPEWRALGGLTPQEDDDMAEISSVGSSGGQTIAGGKNTALAITTVFDDPHKMRKGNTVVSPGYFRAHVTCRTQLTGLSPGGKVRVAWVHTKDGAKTIDSTACWLPYTADADGVVEALLPWQMEVLSGAALAVWIYNDDSATAAVAHAAIGVDLFKIA